MSKTVLLVDDDPHIRFLVSNTLKLHGYRVLVAKNGAQALEVSGGHQGPIDILLIDVLMPGMSGVELLEKFAPLRPETRILLMSDSTIALGALAEHGCLEYLPKPFTNERLLAKLQGLLRFAS